MSSPELLQVVRLHLSYTHVRHAAWADVTSNADDVTSEGTLSDEVTVLFILFNDVRKSPGEKKHARTGYFSYHLTMKEHGGCYFDTNHHDFTSVVAFMCV